MDLTLPVNEHDHVQGPADVPTNLLVYGDYECPYTRASLLVVKQIRERLGDQLRFVQKGGLYIEAGSTNLALVLTDHQWGLYVY